MVITGVLIFGAVALVLLPQELFPQIVYPQLTVVSPYENAAPEEIETLITKPIEEAVGTVAGVKRIRSVSKEGLSLVMAEFGWNQNINFASLGIREKLDLIKERLPREAEEPIVLQYNPFDRPILILSVVSSKDRPPVALRELTRKMIKDELEKVDGVAAAAISGGLEREILVEIDKDKMLARSVPLLDVTKAISNANLNYPAGTIKESFYEYLIRTLGEFENIGEIKEIAIGREEEDPEQARKQERMEEKYRRGLISKDKRLVYLKDIAAINDSTKERTSYSRYNGRENVSVSVQKQALGNTVKIINRVKKKLKELERDLPEDIEVDIVYDQSTFIKESINGVWESAWQGCVLVFLILFYFLNDIMSALIVTLTLPISVIATFVMMFFGNVSINMMSLGGLAFGVGDIADSGIVVLENIYRHLEMNKDKKGASIKGAAEVSVAITGTILTSMVVFLPLIFVIGIIGQISKDFALTVNFSLMASLIAALTVVPLFASKFLRVGKQYVRTQDDAAAEVLGEKLLMRIIRKFYSTLLVKFLEHKGKYLLYTFIGFLLSLLFFIFMDKELMPKVDQGQFIVKIDMPAGTRLKVTNDVTEGIERYIQKITEVESVNVTVGSTKEATTRQISERLGTNQGELVIILKDKRKRSSSDIVQQIKNRLSAMNLQGARTEYILQENVFAMGMETAAPVTVQIKGNKLDTLETLMKKVRDGLGKIKGVYGIKNDLAEPSPETKVFINKDKASLYGLSVVDIAQTSQIALKGYIATKFKEAGQEIDVRVRLRESDRDDFEKLERIQIHSPLGIEVPLSNVATFGRGKGPSEIRRMNQERVVTVYANIYKRPMKDITADVMRMIEGLEVPKDYVVKMTGESEEMKASFTSLAYALIAAILLVYMIMAALFESLSQPLIIMFTIPLSLIGVALTLFITGTNISAYVLMGIGMLGGIVVDNAIVLLDCVNLFISQGMSMKEAVIKANQVRIRPILMTALTTILGLLPMALIGGKGVELRAPLAITVIGGLTIATILTLVVIPAIQLSYSELLDKIFKRKPKTA